MYIVLTALMDILLSVPYALRPPVLFTLIFFTNLFKTSLFAGSCGK